jgi:hypothetical protein
VRRVVITLLIVGVLGATAGACGGSGDDDSATTTTEEPTTTTVDAEEAITETYTAFFDGTNTDYDAKLQMLEDPDAIADLYERGRTNPEFAPLLAQVTVKVVKITPTGEGTADVDFQILLNGEPTTPGSSTLGRAVVVDDEWRVANSTLCTLLGLGDPAYLQDPACKVE